MLLLVAGYPASLGPVAYAVGRYWLPPEAYGLTDPVRLVFGPDDETSGWLAQTLSRPRLPGG